ncbi:MAG: bifunctional precorrin-2 dehydrogenase/sirohydrochlorin ferrochelatase [Candidatus Omnitrophota bacterium]
MKCYPIAVKINDKKAIVAGGGKIATRKALSLISAGACVTVIAPETTERLRGLVKMGRIKWVRRLVKRQDVKSAYMVIAATSDKLVNREVSAWAREERMLVNAVDDPKWSNFVSPAVLKKKRAIVAVYTDGRDPVLSRDLKNFLKEHWDVFLSYRNRPQNSAH